jgi:hypothetical protein
MSEILPPEEVLTISGSQMLGNTTKLLREQCKATAERLRAHYRLHLHTNVMHFWGSRQLT